MRRRPLLASAAALANFGVAGCLDDALAASKTVEQGGTIALPGTDVELGSLSLQSSFVERAWPTWDAHGRDDHLLVTVSLSGADRAHDLATDPPVGVTVDGDRYEASSSYSRMTGGEPTEFAATIPAGGDVDSAALVFETTNGDARYPLADDHLETLRNPPSMSATASIPDAIDGPGIFYEVNVENTGDSAGTLAATSTHDLIHDAYWTHELTVAPGEADTITFTPPIPDGGELDEFDVSVDWGLDSTAKTVRIEN